MQPANGSTRHSRPTHSTTVPVSAAVRSSHHVPKLRPRWRSRHGLGLGRVLPGGALGLKVWEDATSKGAFLSNFGVLMGSRFGLVFGALGSNQFWSPFSRLDGQTATRNLSPSTDTYASPATRRGAPSPVPSRQAQAYPSYIRGRPSELLRPQRWCPTRSTGTPPRSVRSRRLRTVSRWEPGTPAPFGQLESASKCGRVTRYRQARRSRTID